MANTTIMYRTFNGKRYKFDGFMMTLAKARSHAKQRRSTGYNVRIVKGGGGYLKMNPAARAVYIRKK